MSARRRGRVSAVCAVLGVSVVLAGTLAGCGSSASASGHVTNTLYNGQHEQTTDSLVANFEKATGITVKVRSDDEDTLDDQIKTEGSRSPADVIYTENSPVLQDLQNHGLLAPVDPSTLANTPSKYSSAAGDWVGVSARVSVLIYNPSLIAASALPTTALAMADPQYKGKLAIAAGETDFQPIVTSMLRAYGQARTTAWLKAIKANAGSDHTYPDNETIADEVNRGQVAFGIVNQYYWYRLQAEVGASHMNSKITYFALHDPGYVLSVSGAAILKSSSHQAADQRFLAYLTSKAGQETIAHSISFEYPIASGVSTAQPETPFDSLEPNPITVAQLGDGQAAIAELRRAQLL
jgi:iron(III) transport system substrate-binding protein